MSSPALFSLLRLCSSNLPVGGYTFSQGMEYAIDAGWLKSRDDVYRWIVDYCDATLRQTELPVLRQLYAALNDGDEPQIDHINAEALALRETKELLLADLSMGRALLRLMRDTQPRSDDFAIEEHSLPACFDAPELRGQESIAMITAFALAAHGSNIAQSDAAMGYAWTVVENLVLAAAKLLPMGQTACQQMLLELESDIQHMVDASNDVAVDDIGQSLPGLAMASSQHENQYSRLYRS